MIRFLMFAFCISSFFSCGNEDAVNKEEQGVLKTDEQLAEEKEAITSEYSEGTEIELQHKTIGNQLLSLETSMGWDAINELWRERRDAWVIDCQDNLSINEQSELLIELESMVLWTAVNDDWKEERDGWIEVTRAVQNIGSLSEQLMQFEEYILWDEVNPRWNEKRATWLTNCEAL